MLGRNGGTCRCVAAFAATAASVPQRARPRLASSSGSAAACVRSIRSTPRRLGDPKTQEGRQRVSGDPDGHSRRAGLRTSASRRPTCSTAASCFARASTIRQSEHARPTNLFKTGRPTSDTIVYPSIGSIISHERGPRAEGDAAVRRDGLPERHARPRLSRREVRLHLPDRHRSRPVRSASARRRDRRTTTPAAAAARRTSRAVIASEPPTIARRPTTTRRSPKRSASAARSSPSVFDLKQEPDSVRNRYGDEFGQRCLLGPPAGAVGRAVRRGVVQPELHQRHRLGHAHPRPTGTAQADPKPRRFALGPDRRPRREEDARLDARRRRDRVRPTRRSSTAAAAAATRRPRSARSCSAAASRRGQVIGETDELAKKPLERTDLAPRLARDDPRRDGNRPEPTNSTPATARCRSPTTASRSPKLFT